MQGRDLKKALMRRHQVAQHPVQVDAAVAALRSICDWMDWDAAAECWRVEAHTSAAGISLQEAYHRFFTHELRERLNAAKWDFVRAHPNDPAAVEIVELARSWQARLDRRAPDDERPLELPSDEEAYGEPERQVEGR